MTRNPPAVGLPPPIAVGGIGGSGTRLVSELLRGLGVHLGNDLNGSGDTLWFTLLFKRIEILHCSDADFDLLTGALVSGLSGEPPLSAQERAMVDACWSRGREQHPAAWLKARADSLLAAARSPSPDHWGWKEPNTHIVIERLWQRLPSLHYIHVVRHGLDMAFSANQNQLRLWGAHVLGEEGPVTPARSLAYWCRVQQRMQRLMATNAERMYWLDYDALCREPESTLDDLCRFLGLRRERCYPEIRQRAPRHCPQSIAMMVPDDVAFVRSLGYTIHGTA